jgi:hypothetical protein
MMKRWSLAAILAASTGAALAQQPAKPMEAPPQNVQVKPVDTRSPEPARPAAPAAPAATSKGQHAGHKAPKARARARAKRAKAQPDFVATPGVDESKFPPRSRRAPRRELVREVIVERRHDLEDAAAILGAGAYDSYDDDPPPVYYAPPPPPPVYVDPYVPFFGLGYGFGRGDHGGGFFGRRGYGGCY